MKFETTYSPGERATHFKGSITDVEVAMLQKKAAEEIVDRVATGITSVILERLVPHIEAAFQELDPKVENESHEA